MPMLYHLASPCEKHNLLSLIKNALPLSVGRLDKSCKHCWSRAIAICTQVHVNAPSTFVAPATRWQQSLSPIQLYTLTPRDEESFSSHKRMYLKWKTRTLLVLSPWRYPLSTSQLPENYPSLLHTKNFKKSEWYFLLANRKAKNIGFSS